MCSRNRCGPAYLLPLALMVALIVGFVRPISVLHIVVLTVGYVAAILVVRQVQRHMR